MGTADVLLSDAEAIMNSGTGAEAVGPGMCKDGSESRQRTGNMCGRAMRDSACMAVAHLLPRACLKRSARLLARRTC